MTKRLDTIEKDTAKNTSDLSKVKRITIKLNTENFMKLVTEIPILVNYPVPQYEEELGGGGIGG